MNKLTLGFIFTLGLVGISLCGSPCPEQLAITPCICISARTDTTISCKYHDPKLLELAFDVLSSKRMIVDFMLVQSTKLNVIDANFFKNMTVRSALLKGDRWSSINEDAFTYQENSLSNLKIDESLLTEIPVESIGILKELESFAMVNSEISEIPDGAFDGLESAEKLRILDLNSNYIKRIGDGAFSKLTALRTLKLSHNKITELAAGVLPSNNKIEMLNLQYNRLESVPGDLKELPLDAKVILAQNNIDSVSGVDFRTMITNKLTVSLTLNPLKCSCNMKILTITKPLQISGSCTDPITLKVIPLSELKDSDFPNCAYFANILKLL